MKKIKINSPELAKILIDKMLENTSVDYNYVIANQQIEGRLWCTHYSWTQKESDTYKKWWIDFFYNNVTPKRTKKYIEKSWPWFNLQYGLRVSDYVGG